MSYDEPERERGVIVFVNDEKGFGFIQVDNRAQNVFFHARDLRHVTFEKVRKGDTVEVEGIRKTEKGFNATFVYLVS